ncbi:DUF6456 domain-containing protein [Asticcacaulis sp. SL142]|uniref:DUF6456 domain-containing protein n=1 Tax=Asticcacaulis sp. SL142 TaxID=2995155 RepID=UPI00226C9A86|nr:DUF6456 domain-containing protein [Asticcacaulis sp. SL142]WAC47732.1 DUF6456 domain-containing protein [Asticcacaulis sp. SL142]
MFKLLQSIGQRRDAQPLPPEAAPSEILAPRPLSALARLKSAEGGPLLQMRHKAAFEQLARDFRAGFVTAPAGTDWRAFGADGNPARLRVDEPMFRLKARAAYEGAICHLGHPSGDMIRRLMQEGLTLPVLERDYSLPRGQGKVAVRDALERLATYYGL